MIWMTRKDDGGWSAFILTGQFLDLRSLPGRLRATLEDPDFGDRVIRVLFPAAYRDDGPAEEEYRRLLHGDLLRQKLCCLEAFERSIESGTEIEFEPQIRVLQVDLSSEDLSLWLGFLHDLRMVIGTSLDITDDDWNARITEDDPDYPDLVLLDQLTHLEQAIVDALREVEGWN